MNTSATRSTLTYVLGIMLLLGVTWLCFVLYTSQNDIATLRALDAQITEQRAVLVTTADITRANGTDSIVEVIVTDCNAVDRQRFDTLLDSLSQQISNTELGELDTLFHKCGTFYAERKSILAARLIREVAFYKTLTTLRTEVENITPEALREVQMWQEIAESELTWSNYFNDLVDYQGAIILLLKTGRTESSPEVAAILAEVKNAREQMEVLRASIEQLRDSV